MEMSYWKPQPPISWDREALTKIKENEIASSYSLVSCDKAEQTTVEY